MKIAILIMLLVLASNNTTMIDNSTGWLRVDKYEPIDRPCEYKPLVEFHQGWISISNDFSPAMGRA